MLGEVFQRGAQVREVHQQQSFVVGELEHHVHHAFLGLVQVEQAGEQCGPHFSHSRAYRRAEFAEDIPERHGEAALLVVCNADALVALIHLGVGCTRLTDA